MKRAIGAFVLVLAALGALVLCGYNYWEPTDQRAGLMDYMLASAESVTVQLPVCVADEESKERIRGIVLEALDEALHDNIKNLFIVWMKDERGQPGRARVGVEQSIKAHQTARKNAIEWAPPICAG